ncbi:MAG: DUF4135 domain-containing protein, partial [Gammaproteobacteria bacterium]|nr:DUF4135 domain-containing protein [Gammaproteobacteria bacterium]
MPNAAAARLDELNQIASPGSIDHDESGHLGPWWCELAWRGTPIDERVQMLSESERAVASSNTAPTGYSLSAEQRDRAMAFVAASFPTAALEWSALSECRIWPNDAPLPDWLTTAQRISAHLRHAVPTSELHIAHEVPFSRLLAPCVEQLISWIGPHRRLGEGSRADLAQYFVHSLSERLSPALTQMFERWQTDHAIDEDQTPDSASHTHYLAFCDDLVSQGLVPLFNTYPFAARLLGIWANQQVKNFRQFFARLEKDYRLFDAFSDRLSEVQIQGLRIDTPRPRDGGNVAITLRFANNRELIYQPRSLAPERLLTLASTWLVKHCPSERIATPPRTIASQGYGWVESLSVSPDRAHTPYRQAGISLAIAHALGATRLQPHHIAHTNTGSVIADAETLLTPEPVHFDVDVSDDAGLSQSVLRTGLLPSLEQTSAEWLMRTHSGAGHVRATSGSLTQTLDTHTERMALSYSYAGGIEPGTKGVTSADIDEVLGGFRSAYQAMAGSTASFLEALAPATEPPSLSTRHSPRSDDEYAQFAERLLAPAALTDASLRMLVLSTLADKWERHSCNAERRAVTLRQEVRALENGDVPYLSVSIDRSSGRATLMADESAPSPLVCMQQRIADFNPT